MIGRTELNSSSLAALTQAHQTIANNLANANTAGYKRQVTVFAEALDKAMGTTDQKQLTRVQGAMAMDFTQGAFDQTGRPLDLALDGDGFFVLDTPEGRLYTRGGGFTTNSSGQIVDMLGRLLAGQDGPVTLPPDTDLSRVSVALDGTVSANGQSVGKLDLVKFPDRRALVPVGGRCYRYEGQQTPDPADKVNVRQGYQEMSNVNVVTELVSLISATRAYEANIKSISAQDDRMKNLLSAAMG